MRFRIGYDMRFRFARPTPLIMMLRIHDSRVSDLEEAAEKRIDELKKELGDK